MNGPHNNKELRQLLDWHKHNVGLKDLSSDFAGRDGQVFHIGNIVIKFRPEVFASNELINAEILQNLNTKLSDQYAIELDQTTLSYLEKQDNIWPASHAIINEFIPGDLVSLLWHENKNSPEILEPIYEEITNEMMIPSAIGNLLDPHRANFIRQKNLAKNKSTLIDCELALIDPFTKKPCPGSVKDLFTAMADQSLPYDSELIPHCNEFFSIFQHGYRSEKSEHYRQQCDAILINLTTTPSRRLKETGINDLLIKRTLELKKFV